MKGFILILTGLVFSAGIWMHNIDAVNSHATTPSNKVFSDTLKKDPETGLIIDKDLYMVKAQCTSCHSSKLIIANHLTRDGWKQKIRWMQANHNLWELGETEKQVLDYLEKYYAPEKIISRRKPLANIEWYKLDVK